MTHSIIPFTDTAMIDASNKMVDIFACRCLHTGHGLLANDGLEKNLGGPIPGGGDRPSHNLRR